MINKILAVSRIILLLLAIAFVLLFGYKYYTTGELEFSYLAPIAGLLVFYFLTKPSAK